MNQWGQPEHNQWGQPECNENPERFDSDTGPAASTHQECFVEEQWMTLSSIQIILPVSLSVMAMTSNFLLRDINVSSSKIQQIISGIDGNRQVSSGSIGTICN